MDAFVEYYGVKASAFDQTAGTANANPSGVRELIAEGALMIVGAEPLGTTV